MDWDMAMFVFSLEISLIHLRQQGTIVHRAPLLGSPVRADSSSGTAATSTHLCHGMLTCDAMQCNKAGALPQHNTQAPALLPRRRVSRVPDVEGPWQLNAEQ
jgi:hypothetical protein